MKKEKEILKQSISLVEELLTLIGVEGAVEGKVSSYTDGEDQENEFVDISIAGEDLGVLIGYLGRNLKAFQRVAGMMVNKRIIDITDGEYVRVVIDVAGYREGRKDHLESLALKTRDQVIESGEEVDMPKMSSFERRVIHLALSEYDDIKTESFGEGRERHVKVMPAGE